MSSEHQNENMSGAALCLVPVPIVEKECKKTALSWELTPQSVTETDMK